MGATDTFERTDPECEEFPTGQGIRWLDRLIGRRRRFLVNWRQLRASLSLFILFLILLSLLNLSVYFLGGTEEYPAFQERPELASYFQERDRLNFGRMVVGSLIFLLGVFVVAILQSHKTAGAAFSLSRCLGRIKQGHYHTFARLRRDDTLHELEAAFNEMSRALQNRTREEINVLRDLAARAEKISPDPDGSKLAAELQRLIDKKEHTLVD